MIKELIKKSFLYKCYRKRVDQTINERKLILNNAFKKEALDVLSLFSNALMSNDIVFWLDFGTLLGYYREHDFIKHDFDLDTSTWFENHGRVKEVLEQNGFERVRVYYLKRRDGLEECYKHKAFATTIDVFYYFNEGDQSYCFSFDPMVNMAKKRNLNKLKKSRTIKWTFPRIDPVISEFKGVKVYVPENTGLHLESTYGSTYMTPIPDFPFNGRPNKTVYSYKEEPAVARLSVGWY